METRPVREYWDRNLDPLNRRAVGDAVLDALWVKGFRTFASPETSAALRYLGDTGEKRLLEVGSGLGCGSVHLAESGADVVGMDLSGARCAVAQKLVSKRPAAASIRFVQADAQQMPFPDSSFDIVFCRDMLMYCDPCRVASECARVLKERGKAVFVESLRGNPVADLFRRLASERDYARFTRHLSFAELISFRDGLELVRSEAFHLFGVLPFLLLFGFRSEALYRFSMRAVLPLDRWLLRRIRSMKKMAWRGVAVYSRTGSPVKGNEPTVS